jgi:hypothetical protein
MKIEVIYLVVLTLIVSGCGPKEPVLSAETASVEIAQQVTGGLLPDEQMLAKSQNISEEHRSEMLKHRSEILKKVNESFSAGLLDRFTPEEIAIIHEMIVAKPKENPEILQAYKEFARDFYDANMDKYRDEYFNP